MRLFKEYSLHRNPCIKHLSLYLHLTVKPASPAGGAVTGNANYFWLARVTKRLGYF